MKQDPRSVFHSFKSLVPLFFPVLIVGTLLAAPLPGEDPTPGEANPPTEITSVPKESTKPADPDKTPAPDGRTRKGGKTDVDAIGSRNVGGGSGIGNWYSLDSEIRMGRRLADEVDLTSRLVQDPSVTDYVNRVGQNLVRNSDAKVPFTIKVLDSPEINAFALPGGFLYVTSGLLIAADNEAQLAGVMAHEIAHVAARHATRQMTRRRLAKFVSIPLMMTGPAGFVLGSTVGITGQLTSSRMSRRFEGEADYLGLEYMYKAGYDPQALLAFFEKIEAIEDHPGKLARAFMQYPRTKDRIEKLRKEIEEVLPARDEYVITTSDFDEAKQRLEGQERPRLRRGGHDNDLPTLRRMPQVATTNPG